MNTYNSRQVVSKLRPTQNGAHSTDDKSVSGNDIFCKFELHFIEIWTNSDLYAFAHLRHIEPISLKYGSLFQYAGLDYIYKFI